MGVRVEEPVVEKLHQVGIQQRRLFEEVRGKQPNSVYFFLAHTVALKIGQTTCSWRG